jgi:hypothetical protein
MTTMEKQLTLLEELLILYTDGTLNYGTYCYLRDLATKTIESAKLDGKIEGLQSALARMNTPQLPPITI